MGLYQTTFIPYDRKHLWSAELEDKTEKQQKEILEKVAAGKDIYMSFPNVDESKLSLFEIFDHQIGYKVGFWIDGKKTYLPLPIHPCAEDVAMRFIEASEALFTLYGKGDNNEKNEEEDYHPLDKEEEEN